MILNDRESKLNRGIIHIIAQVKINPTTKTALNVLALYRSIHLIPMHHPTIKIKNRIILSIQP